MNSAASSFAKASKGKKSINQKYDPSEIEAKWQAVWEKEKIYSPDLDKATKPFYNLMMFPYPSAEGMHVGNMYAFTGADVYGRFQRMQGKSVFEPIGLDGFGIHSENYAIKVGNHPAEQARISEKNFYKQLHSIGDSFDWSRTVETYKPEYYKWTQWLFIQLFKAGLAYRKKAPVNFCPSCKTVLADEQVEDGLCERCNSVAEKRDLDQWFFKITKYADRLLDNLMQIDWTEKVKIAQRQWIGKSEGALVRFKIEKLNKEVEVFTTRPDTLFGATFLVLSPEHPLIASIEGKEVKEYIRSIKGKSDQDRVAAGKEKTGVFSGLYAINPVNKEQIPVWIADYVLMGYGTGAIMAVPAHDGRDFKFAHEVIKNTSLIREVISNYVVKKTKESDQTLYEGKGVIKNSGEWNGWDSSKDMSKIIEWLEKNGFGKKEVNYHLRDWLISRQRYWGPPIPMIYCQECSWQPVPERDLPVKLPFIQDYKPLGTGKAPLASHPEFYKTKCPKCGGEARRETDVSDTFLDSAWYFLRYVSTDIEATAFDRERVKKWLPVNMYIGGAEHSVLHLLYSRFIAMVLKDLGFISFEEPFTRFRAHGLIVKDGAKMSKSKGNVVVPDAYINKFGADTLRAYLMFMGPFSQGGDFRDTGIEGMHRFLKRVWTLLQKPISNFQFPIYNKSNQVMHKTIKKVTEDIEKLNYNTAIAALMEWYNFLSQQKSISREEVEIFVKLIAPFAPHLSEEIYRALGNKISINVSAWPVYDQKFLIKEEVTIVVQVNGKLRGNIIVSPETIKNKTEIERLAGVNENVKNNLRGKAVKKVIYVEGKVINFVAA
jgi:leucyl-tRNA synthetase